MGFSEALEAPRYYEPSGVGGGGHFSGARIQNTQIPTWVLFAKKKKKEGVRVHFSRLFSPKVKCFGIIFFFAFKIK